jgi:hypothetical protein
MDKIYIKVNENRLWILDYNFVCAIVFIPLTVYAVVKLKNRRIARKEELERARKIKELKKFYRILKVGGSPLASIILLKIFQLRGGGDLIIVPGVDDCIDLEMSSYVDNERILRFVNDRFGRLAINGIIYITKEALCYLVEKEGLVDFPVVFLERIKIDGIYSLGKTASKWGVVSLGTILAGAGFVPARYAILLAGSAWLYINSIEILRPSVKEVEKLTGEFVPRIATRKDAVAFDAKKEPLPPVMEKSIKPVQINTLDTEYEITEGKLVDISKVSGLKNKFSDRRFNRPNRKIKKTGKVVYFSDKVKKWKEQDAADEAISIIDKMLEEGII